MKRVALYLLTAASFLGVVSSTYATTFAIDSLDGDITANELKQFTNSINGLVPPTDNYGDNMSTHGVEVEGMRRMYEATGNMNVLNRLIVFCDVELVNRNDQPQGDHRTMWDGTVAPGWPEGATNTTPACTTGQIHGNIAYCAELILETPSIWNLTVPDGNPYGYGVTYKQRATNYLAKVDQGLGQYITKWFVDTNTFKIHTPTDSRWSPASGQDTAETAWNRQALFVMAYQYSAECHDILGDNPSFLPLYKGIVNKFATWFVTAYSGGGSLYYTNAGVRVAKWYYQIPTDQHIENLGHAQHDMIGVYQAWESGYAAVSSAQMQVYADTTLNIINLGTTNTWADNVDGTGSVDGSIKSDFIFLAQWDPALYKMIAQANIDDGQINGSEGCKNTGYILWMKHWSYLASQDFTISSSPSSRTTTPGSAVTYTINTSAINGFSGNIALTVTGLPTGATAGFSPGSINGAGSSTLTVTTSSSTPSGSSTLAVKGTSGSRIHTVNVTLVVNDFTISGSPSSQTVTAGNNTTYTVTLGSVNGFSSAVNLTVNGLPTGATGTFSPTSVTPAGSSILTVTTLTSTPSGTSTLTVTGTSGSLSHNDTVGLTVTSALAGINLALNKTATSSSFWSASYTAAMAVDGSDTTRWSAASGQTNNQWVLIDLGTASSYNRVVLKEISFPRVTSFKIQSSSDGTNFTDIVSGTTIGASNTLTFAQATSRYVRLLMPTSAGVPTINEIEIYQDAQLFQNTGYAGWRANYPLGSYTTAQLVAAGGVDKDASSVRVPPGVKVTLYTGDNFTGTAIVKTADDSTLVDDGINDAVSSLKVEAN